MRTIAVAALLLVSPSAPALAHGGGLNAEGCHNNRKTGDYHCHRGRTPAAAPVYRSLSASGSVSFANCTAARAAGAAPVYRGDPGYATHLDRDNDGVGCE